MIGMEYGAELKVHINNFTMLIGSNGSSYSSCMRRVRIYPTNRANVQQVLGYFFVSVQNQDGTVRHASHMYVAQSSLFFGLIIRFWKSCKFSTASQGVSTVLSMAPVATST